MTRGWVFWLAAVLSPFLVATFGWGLTAIGALLGTDALAFGIVGIGALLLGLFAYVVLGLPAMWLATRRYGPRLTVFVIAALVANIGSPLILMMQDQWAGSVPDRELGGFFKAGWLFGTPVAAVWAAVACLLYRAIDRAA